MKWLFGSLVLLNLIYWMWASWHAAPDLNAPRARTELNAERMRLLDEPGVDVRPRSPGAVAPSPALTDVAPPKQCFRIGDFSSATAIRRAHAALAARGVAAAAWEKTDTQSAYRVYLPSFDSRAEAEAMRRALTRKGFEDHALINEPGMSNALSLGVYTVRENAVKHQQALAKRGIKAKLQVLERAHPVYWLEFKADPELSNALAAQDWGEGDVAIGEYSCDRPTVDGARLMGAQR